MDKIEYTPYLLDLWDDVSPVHGQGMDNVPNADLFIAYIHGYYYSHWCLFHAKWQLVCCSGLKDSFGNLRELVSHNLVPH